jgi:hypothetical protein
VHVVIVTLKINAELFDTEKKKKVGPTREKREHNTRSIHMLQSAITLFLISMLKLISSDDISTARVTRRCEEEFYSNATKISHSIAVFLTPLEI